MEISHRGKDRVILCREMDARPGSRGGGGGVALKRRATGAAGLKQSSMQSPELHVLGCYCLDLLPADLMWLSSKGGRH